ncbi:hypothetical protein KEM48_003594 [Puccinia striiformis f. sp. tritici PST-130]|nr:hypothetical protein KEM48_003594 [Puccinia striiformis f. sp. tritici PST-130]
MQIASFSPSWASALAITSCISQSPSDDAIKSFVMLLTDVRLHSKFTYGVKVSDAFRGKANQADVHQMSHELIGAFQHLRQNYQRSIQDPHGPRKETGAGENPLKTLAEEAPSDDLEDPVTFEYLTKEDINKALMATNKDGVPPAQLLDGEALRGS